MPRKTPSVVLVGRPNVGKSTLFNRMTGSRRAIVAPIAGTTRDSLARPASWRGTRFRAVRHRRAVRRQRGSAARARRPPGPARHRRRGSAGVARRWPRRAWCSGDETIAQELRADRPAGDPGGQQDRRQARAGRVRWSSTSSDSSRSSRSRPSTARRRRPARRDREAADGSGAQGSSRRIATTPSARDRRCRAPSRSRRTRPPSPSSAGPNVGKSSLVNRLLQGRARARQRDAGHDARRDRRRADLASPPVPHRRHGRHAAARAGARAAGRWSWSASPARRRRSSTPTSSRC